MKLKNKQLQKIIKVVGARKSFRIIRYRSTRRAAMADLFFFGVGLLSVWVLIMVVYLREAWCPRCCCCFPNFFLLGRSLRSKWRGIFSFLRSKSDENNVKNDNLTMNRRIRCKNLSSNLPFTIIRENNSEKSTPACQKTIFEDDCWSTNIVESKKGRSTSWLTSEI
uniref:Uncharacterized protein n=1 Tax=Romanomermis culicivorax TaxID=13658 RepID=A0A915HJ51_ROMCU